jgi:hypothetical protein
MLPGNVAGSTHMKLLLAAVAIAVLVGAGLCSEVILFNTALALAGGR